MWSMRLTLLALMLASCSLQGNQKAARPSLSGSLPITPASDSGGGTISSVSNMGNFTTVPALSDQSGNVTWLKPFILNSGQEIAASGMILLMQSDGDLVLYAEANTPVTLLWTSGTGGPGGQDCRGRCSASFHSAGNLVLYDPNGTPYWWSGPDLANDHRLQLSSNFPQISIFNAQGDQVWRNQ